MKPTKSFRLSKTTKRMMGSILDDTLRNAFKNAMIQAQLAAEQKVTKEK